MTRLFVAAVVILLGTCTAVHAQSVHDADLTREFLQHRFAKGTAQSDLIAVLTDSERAEYEMVKPEDEVAMQLVHRFGATSPAALRKWVEKNAGLVRALTAMEAPTGPQPVPEDFSVLGSNVGPPGPWTIRRTAELLLAAAVLATDDDKRMSAFRAVDNLIILEASGHTVGETSTAIGMELIKYEALLIGLRHQPQVYRKVILASKDGFVRKDMASTIHESVRRAMLSAVADPSENPLGPSVLSQSKRRILDRQYRKLAQMVATKQGMVDLQAFLKGLADPTVAEIIGLSLKSSSFRQMFYLEGIRDFVKAIARDGPDALKLKEGRVFELERIWESDGPWIYALFQGRKMRLWPPSSLLHGGYRQLMLEHP